MAEKLTQDIRDSLDRAGVPSSYHDRSISDDMKWVEDGSSFVDWLVEKGEKSIRGGGGITIAGDGIVSVDMFYMMARALHIIGCPVKVVGIARLATLLDRDSEDTDQLLEVGTVCIRGFEEEYVFPLSRWQRLLVQDFLIERRASGKGSILHITYPNCNLKITKWWNPTTEDIMFNENKLFPDSVFNK